MDGISWNKRLLRRRMKTRFTYQDAFVGHNNGLLKRHDVLSLTTVAPLDYQLHSVLCLGPGQTTNPSPTRLPSCHVLPSRFRPLAQVCLGGGASSHSRVDRSKMCMCAVSMFRNGTQKKREREYEDVPVCWGEKPVWTVSSLKRTRGNKFV